MSTITTNRIAAGVKRYEERIAKNEKNASKADLDKLYEELNISATELAAYMTENSKAFAVGRLNLEESQFIYNKLKSWSSTTLAERITITQVIKELIR